MLYEERHQRMRDAISAMRDPDTAAWLMSAIIGGVGLKDSMGLPRPDPSRLSAALVAALAALA
jgi:hypothetical protein